MNIKDYLVKEQGFNSYNSEVTQKLTGCTWSMFRRTKIETDKECLCNDKPPQIGVYFYSVELQGRTHKSYQVGVVQENDLGWIKFEYYGVDEEYLIENFDKIERSLIRAWEASWCEEDLKKSKLILIQELCNRSGGEIHWLVDDFIKEVESIIDQEALSFLYLFKENMLKEEIVGKVFSTNKSGDCVVTKYVGCNDVYVKFLETGFERVTDMNSLRKGMVKDTSLSKTEKKYVIGKRDIVGEVFENTKGESYQVLEQLGTSKFKIKFIDSGYETEVDKINIERGSIKDRKTLNKDKQLMSECFYDKKLDLDFHIVELTHRKGERKFVVETLDGHIRLTTDSETILSGKVSDRLEVLPVCLEQPLGFSKVEGNVLYNNQDFNELTTYLANIFFYIQGGRLFHRYISYKTLNSDFKSKLQNQSYGVEIKDNDDYVTVLGVKFYRSDVIKLLNGDVHNVNCVTKQESMITNLGLEHEYSIWLGMVNRCNKGYAKLSKEFEVFWDWLSWAKKQKGFMCKDNNGNIFQMESDLFSKGKTYAPDTVVFVPNSINQMCKPSKKGELPKGVQYFSDRAKPYRAYSPYDGIQKHLGYFKTMEEALTEALKGREDYLTSLRGLYSETVEAKVFTELMKPRWYI